MGKIREYAARVQHEVIGKLTRKPEKEWITDWSTGERKYGGSKFYIDEGGNEYFVNDKTGGVAIVTADGGVI